MGKVSIVMQIGFAKAEEIKGAILTFVIDKSEIKNHDFYRIFHQMHELRKAGLNGKNSLTFEFHGYDDDPREVCRIPELNAYIRYVFNAFPEIFYFLNIETYSFAYGVNSIFTKQEEVQRADRAIIEFARENGDTGRIVTVTYYTEHQKEFHSGDGICF